MCYSHFEDIKKSFIEGYPKEWQDYKKIEKRNMIEYYPLIKEMKQTGEILYIKEKIANDAIELEKDALSYNYFKKEAIDYIHELLIQNQDLFKGAWLSMKNIEVASNQN